MSGHALLSASSAHRWIACPGSLAMCRDIPNTSSKYADEGTKAHHLAAQWLDGFSIEALGADDEMIRYVREYVTFVTETIGSGTLLVEKRVDYSAWIGVEDSFGTSDAIIISEDGELLTIIDLKYGMGVRVDAEDNEQLMLYALGALSEVEGIYDISRVRMVIYQPRLDNISEFECDVAYLKGFAEQALRAAKLAFAIYNDSSRALKHLTPGEEQCRFCPAKKTCPALEAHISTAISCEFEAIDDTSLIVPQGADTDMLSAKMKAVPLIEIWCKAIRARVESELFAGNAVEGFKLVEGKRGNRAWVSDDFDPEIKALYKKVLVSPTQAEKILKDDPKVWQSLQSFIVRKDGAPSVAPVSDKRPATTMIDASLAFDVIDDD
jgi:hypothetical protein